MTCEYTVWKKTHHQSLFGKSRSGLRRVLSSQVSFSGIVPWALSYRTTWHPHYLVRPIGEKGLICNTGPICVCVSFLWLRQIPQAPGNCQRCWCALVWWSQVRRPSLSHSNTLHLLRFPVVSATGTVTDSSQVAIIGSWPPQLNSTLSKTHFCPPMRPSVNGLSNHSNT